MDALPTCAFRIVSPCGREYEVPMSKVRDDYAKFLVDNDGLSYEEAIAQMEPSYVFSWFYDQFDWSDVEHYGTCVKEASPAKIKEALDAMRSGSHPSTTATLREIPEEVAGLRAKKLEETLPKAKGAKSPRM